MKGRGEDCEWRYCSRHETRAEERIGSWYRREEKRGEDRGIEEKPRAEGRTDGWGIEEEKSRGGCYRRGET